MRCIYTYTELSKQCSDADSSPTIEHIVPYAAGGSNEFVIPYCSKKANSDYGSWIDAPFLSIPLIGFKRHELGLKGHSGEVPSVRFKSYCVELEKECEIVFLSYDPPTVDFGINVTGSLGEGRIVFSGSADRLRPAIKSLISKAGRKGKVVLNEAMQPINVVEDAIISGVTAVGETVNFRIGLGYDNFVRPWSRGIMKIALGLGAFALGETWAFSAEADRLRACLLPGVDERSNMMLLRGAVIMPLPASVRRLMNVRAGRHSLAVLPHPGGMFAAISLFGGELMEALVDLGNGPANVRVANERLPRDWNCVFHIDPTSRTLESESFELVESRSEGFNELDDCDDGQ